MTLLTDRDLAELFTSHCYYVFLEQPNNKRIAKAFEAWRNDNDKPNRNYTKEGDKKTPSVWQWLSIHNHKTDKWDSTRRSLGLMFQHWLFLQYNEKHWN
jgi:hypothetical protein